MPQEHEDNAIKVYIYGFEPFNGDTYNTSEDVIKLLQEQLKQDKRFFGKNIDLRLGILPVDYLTVEDAMKHDLSNFEPDYIIGMGRSRVEQSPTMWVEQNAYAVPRYKLVTEIAGHEESMQKEVHILSAEEVTKRLQANDKPPLQVTDGGIAGSIQPATDSANGNGHCDIHTDSDGTAGAYLCERSMYMASLIANATFIHVAQAPDEQSKQKFAETYANKIHSLVESLSAQPLKSKPVAFHQKVSPLHGSEVSTLSFDLLPLDKDTHPQAIEDCLCAAAQLKHQQPIMAEKMNGADGHSTNKIVQYEQEISSTLMTLMRDHQSIDPALFMRSAHEAGIPLVYMQGHSNQFDVNMEQGTATHDKKQRGGDYGYFMSLHTGNVFDVNVKPGESVYFKQEPAKIYASTYRSTFSPKEMMAGKTMIASNDDGKTFTTFGSYHRGSYEQNIIDERLKKVNAGTWNYLNHIVKNVADKKDLLKDATTNDSQFVIDYIPQKKARMIAAVAQKQTAANTPPLFASIEKLFTGPLPPNNPDILLSGRPNILLAPNEGGKPIPLPTPVPDKSAEFLLESNAFSMFNSPANLQQTAKSLLNNIPLPNAAEQGFTDALPPNGPQPELPRQPGHAPHKR